jgi:hypothetical protein
VVISNGNFSVSCTEKSAQRSNPKAKREDVSRDVKIPVIFLVLQHGWVWYHDCESPDEAKP